MNGLTLLHPWALLLLAGWIPLGLLRRREARLRVAVRQHLKEESASGRKPHPANALKRTAWALIVIALARPVHSPTPSAIHKGGRDIIFALDVSRSMLATDAKPSRLEKAKSDIRNCLARNPGARVGLLAFAGTATVKVPLTLDHEFLEQTLEALGPGSVAHGSTFLQAAFEKIADRLLDEERQGFQDLILLSDGEDQGSHPEKALSAIADRGLRLLVVGYGDPTIGARIPQAQEDNEARKYLSYEGADVWTRLQETRLRELAASSADGNYLRGTRSDFLLSSVYRDWATEAPRQLLTVTGDLIYQELSPYLLGLAAILLLPLLPFRMTSRAALLLLLCAGSVPAAESDWEARFQQATAQLQAGEYLEAHEIFGDLSAASTRADRLATCAYNRALCSAQLCDAAGGAEEKFDWALQGVHIARRALLLAPRWHDAQILLEGLVLRQRQAQHQLEEEQKAREKMEAILEEIIEALREIVQQQGTLLNECRSLIPRQRPAPAPAFPQDLAPRQKILADQTDGVRDKLGALKGSVADLLRRSQGLPADLPVPTEFDAPHAWVSQGSEAQQRALPALTAQETLKEARDQQQQALSALRAALLALENNPSSENMACDEFSEEEEFGEGEWEESDEEGDAQSSSPMQGGAMRSDFVNKELPTPDYSVEELLQEEAKNLQQREQKRAGQAGAVKKDW